MCSREIFTKKCRQQQIFDSDLKGAWHYNHVIFTPIAKKIRIYCRLIYMLSILCFRLTIKVKMGIPENFKVGWYPPKKTGSSQLQNGHRNNFTHQPPCFYANSFGVLITVKSSLTSGFFEKYASTHHSSFMMPAWGRLQWKMTRKTLLYCQLTSF